VYFILQVYFKTCVLYSPVITMFGNFIKRCNEAVSSPTPSGHHHHV